MDPVVDDTVLVRVRESVRPRIATTTWDAIGCCVWRPIRIAVWNRVADRVASPLWEKAP